MTREMEGAVSRKASILGATLPVAASEGGKGATGRRGDNRHALCRPASPGAIIAKAITDSGRDAEWLRGQLGWKKRFLADVLADRECLGILEAIAIGRVLNRADLKLVAAQCACDKWDEEEAEMAKERR
jgi:plasmid maintenance system antidote protein VapI